MGSRRRTRAVRVAAAPIAIAALALAATPGAGAAAAVEAPAVEQRIAYVTSSASQPESQVWTALANGTEQWPLGPGNDPLLAPDGALVAAGLFGSGGEKGPSLAVYPTLPRSPGPQPRTTFGNLAAATAQPLAWSPDSRYLAVDLRSTAVHDIAGLSGLAVLDTRTGSLRGITNGIIYGASFAPGGSDRIVFARARSESLGAAVNLYTVSATGTGLRRITSDGRSLNPVWGPHYIAYDRERLRRNDAPVYQVWLRGLSGKPRRLTSIRVRTLVDGLVPLGFSGSGARLLAEFEGQDTSEAWTVSVPSGRARPVRVQGRSVVGGAISGDGSRLLVAEGALEGPASNDNVVTVPFGGGAPTLLVAHAAQPSWNG